MRAVPWRLTASFNCCDRLRWLAVAEISCALSDATFASAERTWISNGVGSSRNSTSPFLTGMFGSTGTSITLPATRELIGTT